MLRTRQYRRRITEWKLDKNVKTKEMESIVAKRQRRRLVEVEKRDLRFKVRGKEVPSPKIDGWMKRHDVPESALYAQSPPARELITGPELDHHRLIGSSNALSIKLWHDIRTRLTMSKSHLNNSSRKHTRGLCRTPHNTNPTAQKPSCTRLTIYPLRSPPMGKPQLPHQNRHFLADEGPQSSHPVLHAHSTGHTFAGQRFRKCTGDTFMRESRQRSTLDPRRGCL